MLSRSVLAAALAVNAAAATTIPINVGKGGLVMDPPSVSANVGDVLEFRFYPMSHSVVQGAFDSPCQTGSVKSPFFSGFVPSTSGEASQVFRVIVNDTKPIWYYCSRADHCSEGMVGAVNAPKSGNTFDAYLKASKAFTGKVGAPPAIAGGVFASANETASTSANSTTTHSSASSAYSSTTAAEGTTTAGAPAGATTGADTALSTATGSAASTASSAPATASSGNQATGTAQASGVAPAVDASRAALYAGIVLGALGFAATL
jgi:hypothetical protein